MKSITENETKSNKKGNRLFMKVPFFQTPNFIWDEENDLTAHELLVYHYLARCGNQGATAFPSLPIIGAKTKTSRATAARAVKGLIEKGYIVKHTRTGASNIYEVMTEHNPGVVSEGDGVVSEGDGGVVSQGHPKKNYSFKKNYEEEDLKRGDRKNPPAPAPENPSSILEEEKPKPEAKEQGQGSEVGQALGLYRELFELRADRQPDIKDKDAAALKKVVKKYGLQDTKAMLQLFFNHQDPYYKKTGYSLLTFCGQINIFLTQLGGGANEEEPKAWVPIREWLHEGQETNQGPDNERVYYEQAQEVKQAPADVPEPAQVPATEEEVKQNLGNIGAKLGKPTLKLVKQAVTS